MNVEFDKGGVDTFIQLADVIEEIFPTVMVQETEDGDEPRAGAFEVWERRGWGKREREREESNKYFARNSNPTPHHPLLCPCAPPLAPNSPERAATSHSRAAACVHYTTRHHRVGILTS